MSALQEAVEAHRAGRLEEAEAGYRQALADGEQPAEAHQLLGVLLHRQGRAQEALHHLDQALQRDPEHAGAWANRGLVMLALQQAAEAERSFRRALALRPELGAPRLNLARLLAGTGRGAEAASLLEGLESDEALRLRGMLALQQGDVDGAWSTWSLAFRRFGDPALGRALGQLALQRGRPAEGVAPMVAAYRAGQPVGALLADALVQGGRCDDDEVLARLLVDPSVDAQRVEPMVAERLRGWSDVDAMASPLLRPWLLNTVVQAPEDRARLPRWLDLAREREALRVAEALAVQAWLTEHSDPPAAEAVAAIEALPEGGLREALLGAVRPPIEVSLGLPTLKRVAIDEPAEERALVEGIPRLTPIEDATSQDVAAMYEEHPYPRRVGVHRPEPVSMARMLRGMGIDAPGDRPLQVLVAGAGTGQHPLQTATRYSDVEVLAIDLSRRSLARAEATARRHGVERVRFAQADLLALDLPERFDVIESVGVLHHLAEPRTGLLALTRHLAPGGAMRLGLYSERGRQDVVAARRLVAAWGTPPTDEGLREARRWLLALEEGHPARMVVRSPDFPSSTGLRDLVFHPMEHRFTPLQLRELLDGAGLRFLGFQHNRPEVAGWYRELWPDDGEQRDLARWDAVEEAHPRAFSGMFVFWATRR